MGVVSFDLDGTLWDFSPMMDGAIAAAIASLEEREPELAGRLTVAALHEQRRLAGLQHEGTLEDLRRVSLHHALIELGRDDRALADWMADVLLQARAEVVVLHDDVEPAVRRLIDAGHLVGAITNGNFPFDRLALAAHFSFVVHAERRDPQRLELVLRRIVEAPARDLARRESECCSFFTFEFEAVDEAVVMRIGVPAEHAAVLDALEARAAVT